MLELNSKNFDKEVLQSEKPVIVDNFALWCHPCKILAPILWDLSNELGDIKFAKLDIEKNQHLAQKYNIMSIPCLIIFKEGKEQGRITGSLPKEELKREINAVLTE